MEKIKQKEILVTRNKNSIIFSRDLSNLWQVLLV